MSQEFMNENTDDAAVAKKGKKGSIIAVIACLLIAFVIWCYAKGSAVKNEMEQEGNNDSPTEDTASGDKA